MKNILFIEDDPILGKVYESRLTAAGLEVVRCTDGEQGLRTLQTSRPDLILLDMMLPRVSGLELLRCIRNRPDFAETPVVVFTSSFADDVAVKLRDLGVARILSKSQFVPSEVLAIIEEILFGAGGSAELFNRVEAEQHAARAESLREVEEQLGACRRLISDAGRASANKDRLPFLGELRTPVQSLARLSSTSSSKAPSEFCAAFEALLEGLCRRPDQLNDSALRTVIQSVDFLFEVFHAPTRPPLPVERAFQILVVDDDLLSRRAIQAALRRTNLEATESDTAWDALELCQRQAFDLIFMDVEMPEMSGYELCTRLRKLKSFHNTPVIFVTGHNELQDRAQSSLSGGSDFIGKPFHFTELAVKSLLHLLRSKAK